MVHRHYTLPSIQYRIESAVNGDWDGNVIVYQTYL